MAVSVPSISKMRRANNILFTKLLYYLLNFMWIPPEREQAYVFGGTHKIPPVIDCIASISVLLFSIFESLI